MKIFQIKKTFLVILIFSSLFNFLPSSAESNFKPPVLNSTDLAFNGAITAITVDEMTGIVYVGGDFTKVGEIERNHLAAIETDGTLKDWNPNANDQVVALAINDSTIYVSGYFTKVGKKKRNYLAAIGTNGVIKRWNPTANAHPSDSGIFPLAISGSTIYAGGTFTKIGGIKRHHLAAIGTDGILKDWNPNVNDSVNGFSSAAYVSALAINGSTIYIGGYFNKVGDKTRIGLAAIRTDGTLLDWVPDIVAIPFAIVVSKSMIYVGGLIGKAGDDKPSNFASFSIPDSSQ